MFLSRHILNVSSYLFTIRPVFKHAFSGQACGTSKYNLYNKCIGPNLGHCQLEYQNLNFKYRYLNTLCLWTRKPMPGEGTHSVTGSAGAVTVLQMHDGPCP